MAVQLFIGGLGFYYELADHEIKLNNYDYSELFKNFLNLIWAEDIIVSKRFKKSLFNLEKSKNLKDKAIVRAAMALMSFIESSNNLKELTIHTNKTKPFTEKISKVIDKEIKSISKPITHEQNVPNGFSYNGTHWCHIRIASYYSAIKVCSDLKCSLAAGDDFYNYFKLVNKNNYSNNFNATEEAFSTYFKIHMPQLFPQISINELQCFNCNKIVSCKNSGQAWDKKKIYTEAWKIRCGDEFSELREEVSKTKAQIENINSDREELYLKLQEKRNRCQIIAKRISTISNTLNIISTPAAFLLGCIADSPLLVSLGLGLSTTPIITQKVQSAYYNKNKLALFKKTL